MRKYIRIILIILLSVLFLLPVAATVTNSFMTKTEIDQNYSNPGPDNEEPVRLRLVPAKMTLSQYYIILVEKYKYLNMFWNSVKLSVIISLLHAVVSIMTAYVFAKVEFKGRNKIFFMYIVVMMMPFQVTLLPNYIQARTLNIIW